MEKQTENEKKDATFPDCIRCKRPMEKKSYNFEVGGESRNIEITNRVCPGCEILEQAEEGFRREQEVFFKRRIESRLSKRQMKYSFENFKPEPGTRAAWRALQQYAINQKGFFIFGETCGIGKTHLMAALAIQLMRQGNDVLWINLAEFLMGLRQKMDGPVSGAVTIGAVLRAPILFIDDIGAERDSEWVAETLLIILNKRYEEELPTFISSNLGLEKIEKILGQRIASRIADMCIILSMRGTDHRKLPRG